MFLLVLATRVVPDKRPLNGCCCCYFASAAVAVDSSQCGSWSVAGHNHRKETLFVQVSKWGLAQSPFRDCGQRQTVNHIVDTCPEFLKVKEFLSVIVVIDSDSWYCVMCAGASTVMAN